jgi:uncharacterized membrane-anchored protein YhcB (DUF1043 family)
MAGWVYIIIGVVAGAILGVAACMILRRHSQSIAKTILDESGQTRAAEIGALNEQIKTVFAALSREALSANADDFLKLAATKFEQQTAGAEQSLDGKKALIDAKVEEMSTKLATLTTLIDTMEKDRAHATGSLQGQLEKATQETKRLHETTAQLRDALANPQRRLRRLILTEEAEAALTQTMAPPWPLPLLRPRPPLRRPPVRPGPGW